MAENILEKIVARKRETLASQKEVVAKKVVQAVLDEKFAAARFEEAIRTDSRHVIAEVKKASPSAGVIREDFDGVALAQAYERAGATAISVVTEEDYFQGSLDLFDQIRMAVKVPLLRKDFIVDVYQIYESKLHGADAVLLIAAILDQGRLSQFIHLCSRLKIDAVVEIHDGNELTKVLAAGAHIIGVNARDLTDFSIRLGALPAIVGRIPSRCTAVCESGVKTEADMEFIREIGNVRAVLVGEALVRAEDPEGQLRKFIRALRQ